jgi:hypothetical protein
MGTYDKRHNQRVQVETKATITERTAFFCARRHPESTGLCRRGPVN